MGEVIRSKKLAISPKRCKIGWRLLWPTNWKSYARFRLLPKLMTLETLNGWNATLAEINKTIDIFNIVILPWFLLLFNSKALLSQWEPRDAAVNFDTYRNLQRHRHRAVLRAIARLLLFSVFTFYTQSLWRINIRTSHPFIGADCKRRRNE